MANFKNSVHVMTIFPLQPNQALLVFGEDDRQLLFDAPDKELKLLITLDDGEQYNEYTVSTIAQWAENIGKLKEVYLPMDTTVVGDACFAGLTTLEKIENTQNIRELNPGAFAGCPSLKELRTDSLTVVGEEALVNCESLREVNLSKVTKVQPYAFSGCVQAVITLNDQVEDVGSNAFAGIAHLYYYGNLPGAPWGAEAWN